MDGLSMKDRQFCNEMGKLTLLILQVDVQQNGIALECLQILMEICLIQIHGKNQQIQFSQNLKKKKFMELDIIVLFGHLVGNIGMSTME